MTWPAVLTILLLLGAQLAGVHGGSIELVGRGTTAERAMRRYAMVLGEERLERRQSSSTDNSTAWDAKTTAACMASLQKLNGVASNAAGMAVCYNLPNIDNTTGIFQADLRIYQVAVPTGDFVGVPPQDVNVGLNYAGASVKPISPSALQEGGVVSRRSEAELPKRAPMTPTLLQAYAFVGQINPDLMKPNLNSSALEALVMPIVSLNTTTSSGVQAVATLSGDEASFVSGAFADEKSTTATVADPAAIAAVNAVATPFVLPGTQISIFPIGAIITGVWAVFGIGTVIWGTVGRLRFREHYRRRLAREDRKFNI